MIASESITRRALQHYYARLSKEVHDPDGIFEPLKIIRIGDQKQAGQRWNELSTLIADSKEKRGFGYRIVLQASAPNSRNKQSILKALVFDTADDLLLFLKKTEEYTAFRAVMTQIRSQAPYLLDWCADNVKKLTQAEPDWSRLLAVVSYFRENPKPGIPLRLLPIAGVDTKFVEQNNALLCALLDVAITDFITDKNAKTVARRLGLPELAPLVECAWNCPKLARFFHGCTRLAFAADELATLKLPIKKVVIIENRACLQRYLIVPRPAALVVFGSGFGATLIRHCARWQQLDIQYWGDMDAHGFAILSMVRDYFPRTHALGMNKAAWQANRDKVVTGKPYSGAEPANLTSEEHTLFTFVRTHTLRLEQEVVELPENGR